MFCIFKTILYFYITQLSRERVYRTSLIMGLLMFEFTFEMDDVSDDVFVEGFIGEVTPKIEEFLKSIRSEPWFIQGNRTEGVLTWFGGDSVNLTWKSIDMIIEDGDIFQEEQDHEVEVGVNTPKWGNIFGFTEIV